MSARRIAEGGEPGGLDPRFGLVERHRSGIVIDDPAGTRKEISVVPERAVGAAIGAEPAIDEEREIFFFRRPVVDGHLVQFLDAHIDLGHRGAAEIVEGRHRYSDHSVPPIRMLQSLCSGTQPAEKAAL